LRRTRAFMQRKKVSRYIQHFRWNLFAVYDLVDMHPWLILLGIYLALQLPVGMLLGEICAAGNEDR
jgi:hypothetical protein